MAMRRVRGSPFADIDAYLAKEGLLPSSGYGEVPCVEAPIFSKSHRQSRGCVSKASNASSQGARKSALETSRPIASPQVTGGVGLSATGRNDRPGTLKLDGPSAHRGAMRMAAASQCLALEDSKVSVEAPTRSKHFPATPSSGQPETSKLDLSLLSPEQHDAMTQPLDRPLLVLAGPGSGKTHFLVARIQQALSQVAAEEIIAVTYTRKAADELSQRVKHFAGPKGTKVWVSTVHGLALRFLREAGGPCGMPCKAASEEDRRAAARVVLSQRQMQDVLTFLQALPDSEGNMEETAQAAKTSGAIAKLLTVFDQRGRWLTNSREDSQRREDMSQQPLAAAYQAFLEELRKQRLMDISEVIEVAVRFQKENPGACHAWAASFAQMLFVDEWQDIDTEQQDLLAHLAGQAITAVGDDDQRIYAWRDKGASAPEAFRRHWTSASIKTLGANQRALPELVEAATRLISHNVHREKKELRSARLEEEKPDAVMVVAKQCLNAEACWIAREIQRGGAQSFGAFAVLARTNASAAICAKALSQLGLPVWPSSRKGTDAPRTSPQVLDLLAYLRLVVDPHHDPSFLRICNVPRRGVGKAALRCLREHFGAPAETVASSTLDGVDELNVDQVALRAGSIASSAGGEPATGSFEGAMGRLLKAPWLGSNMRLAQGLAKFAAVLRAARRAAAAQSGAAHVLQVVLAETGLGSGSSWQGSGQKSVETAEVIQQLIAAAEKYRDGPNGAACVVRFLQEMAPRGSGNAGTNSVFVSTIHQAKGLEWDTVFLVQCNEMVMPLQRQGMQSDEQLEEERRLFYVAMTRARNRLVLSFSLKRDSGEVSEPSRFLFETGVMASFNATTATGTAGGNFAAAQPADPPAKSRRIESFQTGLQVQRSFQAQIPESSTQSFGTQSWVSRALESEQALCADFFGMDCL